MREYFTVLFLLILFVGLGCGQKMREEKVSNNQAGRMKVISEQMLAISDCRYRVVILLDTETSKNYLVIPSIGIESMQDNK